MEWTRGVLRSCLVWRMRREREGRGRTGDVGHGDADEDDHGGDFGEPAADEEEPDPFALLVQRIYLRFCCEGC